MAFLIVVLVDWVLIPSWNEISFFWQSQYHCAIEIESFSSYVLESFTLVISLAFRVETMEVHWSSGVMVVRHSEGMRRINQGMLDISRCQITSIMNSVLLQRISKSSLVHVRASSLCSLSAPFIEGVVLFDIKLIVVGEWNRWPVTRLNYTVWWIAEMVNLILNIISFVKAQALSRFKVILSYFINKIFPFTTGQSVQFSFTKSRGMSIGKVFSGTVVLMDFIGVSLLS